MRSRLHKTPVHRLRDAGIPVHATTVELDFKGLRPRVVANRSDVARGDGLADHAASPIVGSEEFAQELVV